MGGGAARADVQLWVSASDPPSPAELGRWERFYIRIGYKADERVVLSAQPRGGPSRRRPEVRRASGPALMLPVFAYTVGAYLDDSNLFPLLLILISPFAVLYLLAVMLLRRLAAQLACRGRSIAAGAFGVA